MVTAVVLWLLGWYSGRCGGYCCGHCGGNVVTMVSLRCHCSHFTVVAMVGIVVTVVVSLWCSRGVSFCQFVVTLLLESLWCHCSHSGATIVTAAPLLRQCGHSEVAVVITIVTVVVSLW